MTGLTASTPFPTTRTYRGSVVALLTLAYVLNFIDRTIISTVGQAIKTDLLLTDTQLGLLGGFAFALFYTVLGIPIARLAERFNRVNIITAAIFTWSAFTALCGMASSFLMLLLFRIGVGVGEAGLSPPALSLISDYFRPDRRSFAVAVYSLGVPVGAMVGAVAGGWLTQTYSWRVALFAVGAPGILVALAIRLTIKEPPRQGALSQAGTTPSPLDGPQQGAWLRHEIAEIRAVTATLFGQGSVRNIAFGVTIASFATAGLMIFVPPYFLRAFGLSFTQVGLIIGILAGGAASIGTLLGGWLADRLGRRNERWHALVPGIGLLIAAPLYLLAYSRESWALAAALLVVPSVLHFMHTPPTVTIVQNMVASNQRATVMAILFFFLNLVALGGGPVVTGWLIDQLTQHYFLTTGDFRVLCPGGAAPAGASGALVEGCRTALVSGTRTGILIIACCYAWAGAHYVIGSIGLAGDLAKARARRGE